MGNEPKSSRCVKCVRSAARRNRAAEGARRRQHQRRQSPCRRSKGIRGPGTHARMPTAARRALLRQPVTAVCKATFARQSRATGKRLGTIKGRRTSQAPRSACSLAEKMGTRTPPRMYGAGRGAVNCEHSAAKPAHSNAGATISAGAPAGGDSTESRGPTIKGWRAIGKAGRSVARPRARACCHRITCHTSPPPGVRQGRMRSGCSALCRASPAAREVPGSTARHALQGRHSSGAAPGGPRAPAAPQAPTVGGLGEASAGQPNISAAAARASRCPLAAPAGGAAAASATAPPQPASKPSAPPKAAAPGPFVLWRLAGGASACESGARGLGSGGAHAAWCWRAAISTWRFC
jgi:hypothetical protein